MKILWEEEGFQFGFNCVLGGWGRDILLQLCKDLHAFYMFSTHWQQFWEAPSSVPGLGGELQVCAPVCCRDFGTKVIQVKPLLKFLPKLLDDRDKNVREETKQLVIELYRWIGAALKPQMTNFKPIQVSSLNLDILRFHFFHVERLINYTSDVWSWSLIKNIKWLGCCWDHRLFNPVNRLSSQVCSLTNCPVASTLVDSSVKLSLVPVLSIR